MKPDPRQQTIGNPGQPWGAEEKALWRVQQQRKRRYADEVLARIERLRAVADVTQYGEVRYDAASGAAPVPDTVDASQDVYPLYALRSPDWQPSLPCMLVTGGVHGYETSGVLGALQFVERHLADYAGRANVLVAPCVSPWAFERIQRWNADAIDPNRSFGEPDGTPSPAQECRALLDLVKPLRGRFLVHIDLHETTGSDETEFRPMLAARDGKAFEPGTIPDGFYLVDDSANPQPEFQGAINAAVAQVTHIAPADPDGTIIGSPTVAPGVIEYDFAALGLCAGITGARYTTTTEVYPDSPRATPEQCNDAQVAAVCAAFDYALVNQKDVA